MTPSTGRTNRWWEAALEAGLDGEPEEPWAEADAVTEGTDLTDDQRALLAGFDDQPAVPKLARLADLDDPREHLDDPAAEWRPRHEQHGERSGA